MQDRVNILLIVSPQNVNNQFFLAFTAFLQYSKHKLEFTLLTHGVHTPCHSEPALAGVGISWYNFTCLGRLIIEVTAYYEIATGAMHPRNDTRFGSLIGKVNNHLYAFRGYLVFEITPDFYFLFIASFVIL